jgi:hypothetical protein
MLADAVLLSRKQRTTLARADYRRLAEARPPTPT